MVRRIPAPITVLDPGPTVDTHLDHLAVRKWTFDLALPSDVLCALFRRSQAVLRRFRSQVECDF